MSTNELFRRLRGLRKLALWFALVVAVQPFSASVCGNPAAPAALPTAEQAEQLLRDGNARFAVQQMTFPHQDRQRLQDITAGQHPFATILTCSDSRVPAELIFDAGFGDLFVVRVAGNVADVDEMASVEYAVDHLNTPLLIVLGHTSCGAVTAKVEGAKVGGFIPELLDNIDGAVVRAKRRMAGIAQDNETLTSCTIQDNVFKSIEDLITHSPSIYERVRDGRLRVIGGVYNIASGKVQWLGEHPRQQCLEPADVTVAHKSVAKSAKHPVAEKGHASSPAHPEGITNDLAMLMLREGNKRFVADNRNHPNLNPSRWEEISTGQRPYATILSCSDSRVPVEHIFDAGLGDLFVVRVAGNVADVDEIGTIEYGTGHLFTPLLVVMGHSGCGAVTAVCDGAAMHGSLEQLTENILAPVQTARAALPNAETPDLLARAVEENVWQSIDDIISRSSEVRRLVESGFLQIAGAIYHLEDGYVEWLGPHPNQQKIMAKHSRPVRSAKQPEFENQDESQNAYQDDDSDR